MQQDFSHFCCFTWICHLDLSLGFVNTFSIAICDGYHAYSIQRTWSCYWLDQFLTLAFNTWITSKFFISLDLSTIYFGHFSGCSATFYLCIHLKKTFLVVRLAKVLKVWAFNKCLANL